MFIFLGSEVVFIPCVRMCVCMNLCMRVCLCSFVLALKRFSGNFALTLLCACMHVSVCACVRACMYVCVRMYVNFSRIFAKLLFAHVCVCSQFQKGHFLRYVLAMLHTHTYEHALAYTHHVSIDISIRTRAQLYTRTWKFSGFYQRLIQVTVLVKIRYTHKHTHTHAHRCILVLVHEIIPLHNSVLAKSQY